MHSLDEKSGNIHILTLRDINSNTKNTQKSIIETVFFNHFHIRIILRHKIYFKVCLTKIFLLNMRLYIMKIILYIIYPTDETIKSATSGS